ncbi:hypothetical protein PC123_g23139 [Phytophthora cactorum]|nr:hypothetical protein PC123_g23139 [Phytophthora cactorum]
MENGGGYPCDRYQYGKTILNGRDANNDAWLYGYLSEARQPTNNQVNDKITPWSCMIIRDEIYTARDPKSQLVIAV